MRELLTSLRLLAGTVLACCVVYPGLVWLFANAAVPDKAEGSLVYAARGGVVGSKLIAQRFTRGEYFWPRPSAVDYNASATGGSNLSPASPQLAARAGMILQRLGAGRGPVPADLVTASGSGVDPHISLAAARWQAPRVAAARRVDEPSVLNVVSMCSC